MAGVFASWFFPLLLVLAAAFLVFDQLVKREYMNYRTNWETDGMRHGFFWVPDEAKVAGGWIVRFGSTAARDSCLISWSLSTPEWMRRDEKALRLIFWLRILTVVWIGGWLGMFLTMAIVLLQSEI